MYMRYFYEINCRFHNWRWIWIFVFCQFLGSYDVNIWVIGMKYRIRECWSSEYLSLCGLILHILFIELKRWFCKFGWGSVPYLTKLVRLIYFNVFSYKTKLSIQLEIWFSLLTKFVRNYYAKHSFSKQNRDPVSYPEYGCPSIRACLVFVSICGFIEKKFRSCDCLQ